MHPNAFLRSFWRLETRPLVFVAMSFSDHYRDRYDKVVAAAIREVSHDGAVLRAYRVDEVGLALACRHPSEVLLIRDDRDKFLFDVSTVPHMHFDFNDHDAARDALKGELQSRLRERDLLQDARLRIAVAGLNDEEIQLMKEMDALPEKRVRGWQAEGAVYTQKNAALARLLEKGLVELVGIFDNGRSAYRATKMGRAAAKRILALPTISRIPNPKLAAKASKTPAKAKR